MMQLVKDDFRDGINGGDTIGNATPSTFITKTAAVVTRRRNKNECRCHRHHRIRCCRHQLLFQLLYTAAVGILSCFCYMLPLYKTYSTCQAFIGLSTQQQQHQRRQHNQHRSNTAIQLQYDNRIRNLQGNDVSISLSSTSNDNDDDTYDNIYVMVNGMPGPMATAAAEACLRKGLLLSPMAMTGPDVESSTITVTDPITQRTSDVRLISSSNVDEIESTLQGIRTAIDNTNDILLAIDYTHPSAVNQNGQFYVKHQIPFVMGTTGGDRNQLLSDVTDKVMCVIAPNMGKQIVAMQTALSDLGTKFPGAFAGYTLHVIESHQKTKADTSGTAKAVIDSIKVLSNDNTYSYDDIEMIRNDTESIEFGVPETALQGHAYHTYTLTSPDKSVQFQLQHNVIGRTVYADGTADAIKFLAKQVRHTSSTNVSTPKVYTMMDVLAEGALE